MHCAGIEAISFKGPTLAVMAYGDLGCRDFTDLDIFVSPEKIKRAVEVLAENGYAFKCGREVLRAAGEIEVEMDNGRGAVDLHWKFIPKYFGCFEPDYARTVRVSMAGFDATTLRPEDLLVYLAADYARDCWQSLSMIADVAHLISRRQLDWDEVLRCSER